MVSEWTLPKDVKQMNRILFVLTDLPLVIMSSHLLLQIWDYLIVSPVEANNKIICIGGVFFLSITKWDCAVRSVNKKAKQMTL